MVRVYGWCVAGTGMQPLVATIRQASVASQPLQETVKQESHIRN